jgi:hypothetical protein
MILGCLQSLYFREMDNRQDEVNRATDNTCAWLLKHQTFQEWLYQNRGLLWIAGKPGAGKSTLLKHAFRNITNIEPAAVPNKVLLISFFFHGRGTELQKTPLGLFRTILHQLLAKAPSSFSDLVQTFKERCDTMGNPGEKWNWRLAELQDIIEASLPKILGKYSIRIFVDALDECQREAAIEVVKRFQNLILKAPSTSSLFSICFTCRHYPILVLDHIPKIYVERENNDDIATYIRRELKDNEGQLADTIISRAQGVFQWVFLVVKQVSILKGEGKTTKQIKTRIQQIPQDLDNLYRKLLKGIREEEKSTSLKLIQWVCFAIRPLSLDELRFAMVIDANTRYTSLRQCQDAGDYADDNKQMESNITHLSCGLIEIQAHGEKRIAQFIHQSVGDFFLGDGLQILDSSQSTDLAIGSAHHRLSRSCIRYIAMEEIGQLDSEQLQESDSKFPFLKYATTAWVAHSEGAEAKNTSQADLLGYLHWPSSDLLQRWVRIYQVIDRYSSECPPEGTTLLHIASSYNLISFLSAILESLGNSDINIDSKDMAGLLEEGVDISTKDSEGVTALHWAVKEEHEMAVSLLVKSAKSIDIVDEYGYTPLIWAIEQGSEAVIKLLLAKDPKLDYQYLSCVSNL